MMALDDRLYVLNIRPLPGWKDGVGDQLYIAEGLRHTEFTVRLDDYELVGTLVVGGEEVYRLKEEGC